MTAITVPARWPAATWQACATALLLVGVQGLVTACFAQEVFTPLGFHRHIPEYVDSASIWDRKMEAEIGDLRAQVQKARKSGHSQPALVRALSKIGAQLDYQGDHIGAQRYHEEALKIAKAVFPTSSTELAAAWHNLAANCELQKRYDDALSAYGQALDIWQLQNPVDRSKTALEYFCAGRAFEYTRGYDAAISAYKKALQNAEMIASDQLRREILQQLLSLLERQGRKDEAGPYAKQYNDLLRKEPGQSSQSGLRGRGTAR